MSDTRPDAMAFHDCDDLGAAFRQARAFAGEGGRVATMADIVDARLATTSDEYPWGTYFTGVSTEFYGRSPAGHLVLAVLHGGGPMGDPEGAVATYAAGKPSARHERDPAGRIPVERFHRILSGHEGPVEVVDAKAYMALYEYPYGLVTADEARRDPLVSARLGGRARADAFVDRMMAENDAMHGEDHRRERRDMVLAVRDSNNLPYHTFLDGPGMVMAPRPVDDGTAMARLLSMAMLVCSSGGRAHGTDMQVEVDPTDAGQGARFVGLRKGAVPGAIHPGFSHAAAVREGLPGIWTTCDPALKVGLSPLCRVGGKTFTQVPKDGVAMDTGMPRHPVDHVERIGDAVRVEVPTAGYHGVFRYDIGAVRAVAPAGAVAYDIDGIGVGDDGRTQHASVTFYRGRVDGSRRLLTREEVAADVDLLVSLAGG